MLEPELFGYGPGMTAGGPNRPGRLEFAHHGTLFLDHVWGLPTALQLRLQRVLDEGGFSRAGARDAVVTDVRVLASSDRDLDAAAVEGRFLPGLLSKLNGLCLTLSPLRQRRAELRELAAFFVRQYATHYNKPESPLSEETFRLFAEYPWPGNLQELEAVVERIVLLGHERSVREELTRAALSPERQRALDRPTPIGAAPAAPGPRSSAKPATPGAAVPPVPLKEIARQAADGAERELIYETLQRTRWNRREAAQRLGVSYKALLYKIKRAETHGAP